MATHSKVLGLTLDETHIQYTHSQHLSTRTQASTNKKKHSPKQDGVTRMRHSWLPTRQSWYRLWSMPLPYRRLFHPQPALTNYKACTIHHWGLSQDAHKIQTYNICMTKHSHFPYTSSYSSTPHTTNRNTLSITSLTQTYNIFQHFKGKKNTNTNFPTNPILSLQHT